MEEPWIEDRLFLYLDSLDASFQSLLENEEKARIYRSEPLGIVRISNPKWQSMGKYKVNNRIVNLLKVRIRFQFITMFTKVKFISAKCECYITSDHKNTEQPSVFDFFPKEIVDGGVKNIHLAFKPEIYAYGLEASVGEISSDLDIGQVIPIVIGYPGNLDRNPYWELRPGKLPVQGTRDFWLVIEQPATCNEVDLRIRAEGKIQSFLGPLPITPRNHLWENRPVFRIVFPIV